MFHQILADAKLSDNLSVMMNVYDIVMTPIERFILGDIRRELVSQSMGSVLEIGVGTGVNLKYYDYGRITSLTCLDIEYPEGMANKYPDIRFVSGSIEEIPFCAQSFDCAISTLVLCTVNIEKSLQEIQRVMKNDGKFIFIEHVKPSGHFAAKIADSLNPAWSKLANGCNLNRETDVILKNSGFNKVTMKSKGVFRYGVAEKG